MKEQQLFEYDGLGQILSAFPLCDCYFLFQMALRLIFYRYSSKLTSISIPSAVFSSSPKITLIYSYSLYFQFIFFASASFFTRTNSSSRVSSTVMVYLLGRQYIRNWVRWKIFLGSIPVLSKTHFLYIWINSRWLIFLSSFSSISHIMRSIYFLPILFFIPILPSTVSMSEDVKYYPSWREDKFLNTVFKYFSSVEFRLNYSSFSSIVFCFSAFLRFKASRSNLNSFLTVLFSLKSLQSLYLSLNWGGRSFSVYVLGFYFYAIISYIGILPCPGIPWNQTYPTPSSLQTLSKNRDYTPEFNPALRVRRTIGRGR